MNTNRTKLCSSASASGLAALAATLMLASAGRTAAQEPRPCREHPRLSGQCFDVAGRARLWNGNPSIRIQPRGTKRLLGVSEGRFFVEGYANAPPELKLALTWDNMVDADFHVCPFEDDVPGKMRLICVQSVANIRVIPAARR